jgi:ABC-2 type transport system permease protein
VRHSVRSIDAVMVAVLLPVLILLLFVYVFGGAIDTAGDYVDYVVPGIILLCAGYGSATTALSVNQDMTTGVNRPLPLAADRQLRRPHRPRRGQRAAQPALDVLVLAVALLIGFDPHASALDWLGVAGSCSRS